MKMSRSKYIVCDNRSIRVAIFPLGYQLVHTNTYMPLPAHTRTYTQSHTSHTHMETPIYAFMHTYVNGRSHTHIYTPPPHAHQKNVNELTPTVEFDFGCFYLNGDGFLLK